MTQTQLLVIDSILPTILGCIGLVFLAAGFWPLSGASRTYLRSGLFALVGVVGVALRVWLWLILLRMAGQIVVQEPPAPGTTTSISTAQRPSSASSPSVAAPSSSAAAAASP